MVIGYSLAEYTCYHIDRIFIISLLHKFNSIIIIAGLFFVCVFFAGGVDWEQDNR